MTEAIQRYRSRVPSTAEEALRHTDQFGFPVEIVAYFVPGGWNRTASSKDELMQLLDEAWNLSPVSELQMRWPNNDR